MSYNSREVMGNKKRESRESEGKGNEWNIGLGKQEMLGLCSRRNERKSKQGR